MSKEEMDLREIEKKKWDLETEESKIKSEIKQLTIHHQRALIEECATTLLNSQKVNGELSRIDIQLHLQELTTKVRGLYDK